MLKKIAEFLTLKWLWDRRWTAARRSSRRLRPAVS